MTIIYCRPYGYEKRAKDAAAALRRQLGMESDLVSGKGGIFQVKFGDRIVASRSKGHLPGIDEIVAAVTAARH